MEKIYDYIFTTKLEVDSSEYKVMIIEDIMNLKINKERMIQIMFEMILIFYIYCNFICLFINFFLKFIRYCY